MEKLKRISKIVLIISILVILLAAAYISSPNLSYGIDNINTQFNLEEDTNFENVEGINVPANSAETVTMIREHRGNEKWANFWYPDVEDWSYEQSEGNTGIKDINDFLNRYLNNVDAGFNYGWYGALRWNTSVYCRQKGTKIPSTTNRLLSLFHDLSNGNQKGGYFDTNNSHLNDFVIEHVEKRPDIACTHEIPVSAIIIENDDEEIPSGSVSGSSLLNRSATHAVNGINTDFNDTSDQINTDLVGGYVPDPDANEKIRLTTVKETDLDFEAQYIQKTYARLRYEAVEKIFDIQESYYFSYSKRIYYANDPAQIANWIHWNFETTDDWVKWITNGTIPTNINLRGIVKNEEGTNLFKASTAVSELKDTTKPQMSVTTDSTASRVTGTVLDGSNYKIGPIYMNDYTYAWCDAAKDYSGELICGLVEAKLELDNGRELTLGASNFSYSEQDIDKTTFVNPYYESPSLHEYQYPTPNSKFYISIPILECTDATKVEKITMKYKWTTADGKGGLLNGYYDLLEWTGVKTQNYDDCHYDCTNIIDGYECANDGLPYVGMNSGGQTAGVYAGDVNLWFHTFKCPSTGYCSEGTSGTHQHHVSDGVIQCVQCTGCQKGTLNCTKHVHSSSCRHSHGTSCRNKDGVLTCTKSTTSYTCGKSGHTHTDWSSPSSPGCYNTAKCSDVALDRCYHGHTEGIHDNSHGECLSGRCSFEKHLCHGNPGTGLNPREGSFCPSHGDGMHRTCCQMIWTVTKETPVESQRLMYVTEAKVDEHEIECYIENIPLVTKVEINKYIYDVQHNPNKEDLSASYDSAMVESDVREDMSEEARKFNPVYVEYGDYVTYKIILKNYSAFSVKVRATDELPPESNFISAYMGDVLVTDFNELRNKILIIGADSEVSFTVTVRVEALEGDFVNTAKIITRNGPNKDPNSDDVDYIRVTDDDGPVVNHTEIRCNGTTNEPKLESEDWYKLNDYNLSIAKYVSSYDAKMLNKNKSEGFINDEDPIIGNKFFENLTGSGQNRQDFEDDIRFNESNSWKKENPFEVEKTETIVYSIRLTNEAKSTDRLGNEISFNQEYIAQGIKPATQVRPTKITETFDSGLKFIMNNGNSKAAIFKADGTLKKDGIVVKEKLLGNNTFEYSIGSDEILDPGEMLIYFIAVEIEKSNMYLPNIKNTALINILTNVNNECDENNENNDRIIYSRPDLDTPRVDRNINDREEAEEYVKQKELVIAGTVFIDEDRDGIMESKKPDNSNRLNKVPVILYRVNGTDGVEVGRTETNRDGFYTFERVDKANNKRNSQTGGNGYYKPGGYYEDDNQSYFDYYIEFEYDGITHKVTEIYGGRNEAVNPNYGENNINERWLPESDGSGTNSYKNDSNAYEFTDVREDYNKQFETFGYNKAYAEGKDKTSGAEYVTNLVYDKNGHKSELVTIKEDVRSADEKRAMVARTFVEKNVIPADSGGHTYVDVNRNLDKTKTLWLYKIEGDEKLPETEYLKYINLGLLRREEVNVSLAKDLYSITTTINGEQVTYDFNENGVKNNEVKIKNGIPVIEEEADGATEDFNETNGKYIDNKNYFLDLYASDFYYRVEQYEHQAVIDYKTIYSELNIEVTFKITISNEKITQDEENMEDVDREVIVTIDEIADYYDENFIEYTDDMERAYRRILGPVGGANEDTDYNYMTQAQADTLNQNDVVTIKVKVPDDTQTANDPNATKLIDRKLEVVKAWYYKDGQTTPTGLIVTNHSNYNPENEAKNGAADGYRKLYIRGFNQVKLKEGESVELYVKYIVDKENGTRNLKIIDRLTKNENTARGIEGIAEISAYSTWYQDYDRSGGTATILPDTLIPAGVVDKNSNPDNLGEGGVSIDNIGQYEDDTYKTGVMLHVKEPPVSLHGDDDSKRKISGKVWDDARSTPQDSSPGATNTRSDTQYSGNGLLSNTDIKNPNAKMNPNINKHFSVTEERDIMVRNARVDLVEIVQIGDRYYEEIVRPPVNDPAKYQYTTRTTADGKFELYGFKPGYYVVRFTYGDYPEGNTQAINDMAVFNGQDYKSTKYTAGIESDTGNDVILERLEHENINDARDDEIDRLNTISYSEIMVNHKAEILKGNFVDTTTDTNALVEALLRNTAMSAETVRFYVKPEKLTGSQINDFVSRHSSYSYSDLSNIDKEFRADRNFEIKNVDFGIEYRPEAQINLIKEVDNISLVTSNGEEILKLYVNTTIERDPSDISIITNRVHTIDTARSKGIEQVPFLSNEYTFRDRSSGILDELLEGQGFIYINIDDEILQGSTVTIQYRFTAENISEIDRIGTNLNTLRFKNNAAAQTAYQIDRPVGTLRTLISNEEGTPVDILPKMSEIYNSRYGFISKGLISNKLYKYDGEGKIFGTNSVRPANTHLYDTDYTGAGTAGNILIYETYRIDENSDIYRVGLKKKYTTTGGTGYYGRFLGDYYYDATATSNDVVAQIKFDKILDYVDNDLVFNTAQNSGSNGHWTSTTANQLRNEGYLTSLTRNNVFTRITNTYGEEQWSIVDNKGVSFDSVRGTNPDNMQIMKSNLAISVSDRTTDDNNNGVNNVSLSRFLTPVLYDVANNTYPTSITGILETPPSYLGQVMLTASKVISEETLSEDMSYENLAEIIQFTITSGRRTNFITTIGNAKIENGEWSTATEEPDTSASERVTFTPPTGLTRRDKAIRKVVEESSKTISVVAIVAIVASVVLFGVRFITFKIRKRRIK